MLNKSHPQGVTDTGRRRYDLPGASHGASLRGPYKLWIPKADNHHSESENEGSRPAPAGSNRPHLHHGSATHAAGGNAANTPAPSVRQLNATSTQNQPPASLRQPIERTPLGYSSESTVHAPPNPSKPSSSFSLFKSYSKDPRGQSTNKTRRDEQPYSSAVPAVPSKHTASQPVSQKSVSRNIPVQDTVSSSPSTLSSTEPSPRSSTDSGPGSGHASAPPTAYSETRKRIHSTRNHLYVDARDDQPSSSQRNESSSIVLPWDDRKTKDKEDMVAKVTEALGRGSTGKAKTMETALLHGQAQFAERDDIGSTRRTIPSTAIRVAEPYGLPQDAQPSGRHKTTPQPTPLPSDTHPPVASKSSRNTTNSRNHVELSSRSHGAPELAAKVASSNSKLSITSPSPKAPHPRSASSPWPFNQALPPEQVTPHIKPLTYSSSWKPFARSQGSSTTKNHPPDLHPSTKEFTSYPTSRDVGRNSQQAYIPSSASHQQSSKSWSRRSAAPPSLTGTLTTSHTVPTSAPAPTPSTIQVRTNPTTSTAPQRRSPNTHATGRPAVGQSGAQQSYGTSQTLWLMSSKHSETTSTHPPPGLAQAPTPITSKGYLVDDTESNETSNQPEGSNAFTSVFEQRPAPVQPATTRHPADGTQSNTTASVGTPPVAMYKSGITPNLGAQPQHDAWTLWSTTSGHSEPLNNSPVPPEHSTRRYVTVNTPEATIQPAARSASLSTSNPLWSTAPRKPETTGAPSVATESVSANTLRNVANDPLTTTALAAGTWTSKYTQETYPTSDYETEDLPNESTPAPTHHLTHGGTGKHSPPQQGNSTPIPEKVTHGAWTSHYTDTSAMYEVVSAQKPSPRATIGDNATSAALKYASVTPYATSSPLAPEPTSRALQYPITNSVAVNQQTPVPPGAWTTNTRYATNTSGSIFESSHITKGISVHPRETSARQTTLGTTPVAGAWTIKKSSGSGTSSSSEATIVRQAPISQTPSASNTPATSSFVRPPPPTSGTNTGSSTPSSTQVSDVNQLSPVTSYSISTRVPISGHPSTPAPVRPTLRATATPPPLSISSTLPDTDSLLTPSSLNSPRSTIALSQPQPVSTITGADMSDKENAPRKNGFFDFFRPKSSLKSYEVWTPPARPKEKGRPREEQPKQLVPSLPKTSQTMPVPIPPRPKSPKFFSPFKLFAKRHRTVSSASLDVLDGTAPNTVMNSPASSMQAETPGAPPSPPLRDAFLATQEWRNREATELVTSGRKRRHRPGVTFDCPEEGAPIDILPSRLRIGRMGNYDDDEFQ